MIVARNDQIRRPKLAMIMEATPGGQRLGEHVGLAEQAGGRVDDQGEREGGVLAG